MNGVIRWTWVLVAMLAVAGTLQALVEPDRPPHVAARVHRHVDLDLPTLNQQVGELPPAAADQARQRLARLGINEATARIDKRSGRFVTLLPSTPLIPGKGAGNSLSWETLNVTAPQSRAAREQAAWDAFLDYLTVNQDDLGIDLDELSTAYKVTSHGYGNLYQIYVPRTFDGIPVRGSYLSAIIGQGNLTLMGLHRWGDRGADPHRPRLSLDEAILATENYLAPLAVTRHWAESQLIYVPMARGNAPESVSHGRGYRYQLAWSVKVKVDDDDGSWEALVDAYSGEVLTFEDLNQYAEVKGGVLPVTNDGVGPGGVEQPGWPMPYQEVSTDSGTHITGTGGNLSATGNMTATFYGPYVDVFDYCGSDYLTQTDGIDWGASGGTDCTTPGFGGAGNTHAARTGFYELNKIKEMARGQLPSNLWLQQRLRSNVNINNVCNAYWNGTLNFYRSGAGCSNTGEIASILDHEWGHGLDQNDATPGISGPSGEGIADVYTALRLNDSCIGRNFRPGVVCNFCGDPCLTCTGVRDIDYLEYESGLPHDFTWAIEHGGGYCMALVYSEAVWSLWKRKLQSPPYNYDNNTAQEIVTRLTYIGAGATSTWFSGSPPWGGCAAGSGYLNYLAADDDNGNLNDGTPHMQAIYDAFNDQEIACPTPPVQDSGCVNTPTIAPVVTAGSGDQLVTLSWAAVPNATKYGIYRTEGVFGCDFGKVKLGETASTSFTDTGLQNGRDYSYVVIPMGAVDSCFGPASPCITIRPFSHDCFTSPVVTIINPVDGSIYNECETVTFTGVGIDAESGDLTSALTWISSLDGTIGSGGWLSTRTLSVGTHTITASVTDSCGLLGSDSIQVTIRAAVCAGLDLWTTPVNGGQITIEVPRGYFCDGDSEPITTDDPQNPIFLKGKPLKTSTEGVLGPTDTVMERLQDAVFEDGVAETDVIIRALSLVSVSPLTVDCGDGSSEQYDVVVSLDGQQEAGRMTIYSDPPAEDPVFNATFPVTGHITFFYPGTGYCYPSPVPGDPCSDLPDLDAPRDITTVGAPWTSTPGPGIDCYGLMVDSDGDGEPDYTIEYEICCGDNFRPAGLIFHIIPHLMTLPACLSYCAVDADCDDGFFCNGAETCNLGTGQCEWGTPVDCNDGVACTDDSCNEETDSCDHVPNDANCTNGLFCDGAETCDAILGCQAGTALNCTDGVGCTVDSCNEGTDQCDNTPDDGLCDNGLFCDGAEYCDVVLDCQAGTAPCPGPQICDEVNDVCEE